MTDTEFDFANGIIRLFEAKGCEKAALAYWAGDRPFSTLDITPISRMSNEIRGEVKINGVVLHAQFDTGTPRSMLTRRAAREIGADINSPGARPGGLSLGLGHGAFQTWIVRVESLKIGDEEVKHTELRVGDIDLEGDDMLLGADFFLSHRVFVAKSQRKLYLTYNGGPVFNLENTQGPGALAQTSPGPSGPAADDAADGPKDADGYTRRGDAFMSRHQYASAIADFTHAVALEPSAPQHLIDRGTAYLAAAQPEPALADFSAALKLKPDDVGWLLLRGRLRLREGDATGAAADFDAATKLDPSQHWPVSFAYQSAGRYADEIRHLDAWIATNPKGAALVSALNGRCWARALWGQALDEAEADCDAALAIDQADAPTLDSRGLVRLRRGELDGSIADYTAALRQMPKNAWSLYGRGVARLRKGQTPDGEADIAKASAIDPAVVEFAKQLGVTP